MNERFQNLRMAALAMLLFLVTAGSAYTGAYFYLGAYVEDISASGTVVEVVRTFRHEKVAMLFMPMGRLEALVTQRRVVVTGPVRVYGTLKQISISLHHSQ